MGLKTKKPHYWLANELELLKKLYPTESTRSIANKLGRSLNGVKKKAYKAGFRKRGRPTPWSRQEDMLLKKLHPDNTASEIASQIGRSVAAITNRAHRLELKKCRAWSKKELNLLKKLYPSRTLQKLAKQIGRSVPAVQSRILKLGLKKRVGYEESHRVVSGMKQKRCYKCKQWKPENMFFRASCKKDGLTVWCKECSYKAVRKSLKRRLALRNLIKTSNR